MRYAIQRCCCCIKKLNCYKSSSSIPYYEPLCIQIIEILPGREQFSAGGCTLPPQARYARQLPQGDALWQCRKLCRRRQKPFPWTDSPRPGRDVALATEWGAGGIAVGDDGRGAPAGASSLRNLFPCFRQALYLSAPGNVLYYKNKKSVRFLRPAQKALRTTR